MFTDDKLDGLFEQSMTSSESKLDLSKDEQNRLTSAMKEPEFRSLLQDYLTEISDPKNRAEYNAYIDQLESDGKVPQDSQLVRPKAAFCVKTKKKSDGEKVFLNICSAELLEPASSTPSPGGGGVQWSLPHMLGAPHMEQDHAKKPCVAFEICFHPSTIARAVALPQFRDMVVKMSIEAVENSWKHYLKAEETLDPKYRVLKGVKAIGGTPKVMTVKKDKLPESAAGAAHAPTPSSAGTAAEMCDKTGAAAAGAPSNERSTGKSFEQAFKERSTKRFGNAGGQDSVAPSDGGPASTSSAQPSALEPSYTIVERGTFQLRNHMSGPQSSTSDPRRPENLVVKVELPRVAVVADVELDIAERTLNLSSKDAYQLTLRLPYPVFGDKGTAKWNKLKKQLTITLPVQPPPPPPPAQPVNVNEELPGAGDDAPASNPQASSSPSAVSEPFPNESTEDAPTTEALPGADTESASLAAASVSTGDAVTTTEKDEGPSPPSSSACDRAAKANLDHPDAYASWMAKGDKLSDAELLRMEEQTRIQAAERTKEAAAVLEAQRNQADAFQRIMAQTTGASQPEEPSSTSTADDPAADETSALPVLQGDFMPAPAFAGSVLGAVFKSGPQGLGYYKDTLRPQAADGKSIHSLTTAVAPKPAPAPTLVTLPADVTEAPWSFRQDNSNTTVIVELSSIDESSIEAHYEPTACYVRFEAGLAEDRQRYQLLVGPPAPQTIVPAACSWTVTDRNMLVSLAKGQKTRWPKLVDPTADGAGRQPTGGGESNINLPVNTAALHRSHAKTALEAPETPSAAPGGNKLMFELD